MQALPGGDHRAAVVADRRRQRQGRATIDRCTGQLTLADHDHDHGCRQELRHGRRSLSRSSWMIAS
jgi:hypothetical protein